MTVHAFVLLLAMICCLILAETDREIQSTASQHSPRLWLCRAVADVEVIAAVGSPVRWWRDMRSALLSSCRANSGVVWALQ